MAWRMYALYRVPSSICLSWVVIMHGIFGIFVRSFLIILTLFITNKQI